MYKIDPNRTAELRCAQAYSEAIRMSEDGAGLSQILTHLVHSAEAISSDDSVSSILLLDNEGLLRNAASPRLPEDYLQAIDGLKPDPSVGTCAAAAATGAVVLTPDFCADHKWAELRHLPLSLGFQGAWSHPIKAGDGRVLGTFGTYFRRRRVPTPLECDCVGMLAEAAAAVIQRKSA